MNSPYSPPKSVFAASPRGATTPRWRGAVIFALIPALILLAFQAERLYSEFGYWGFSKIWEPTIYLLPAVASAAIVGFVFAVRCVKASWLGILPLGAVIGVLWALGIVCAVSVVMTLSGEAPKTPGRAFLYLTMILVPPSIALCAAIRFYGKKQGFLPGLTLENDTFFAESI